MVSREKQKLKNPRGDWSKVTPLVDAALWWNINGNRRAKSNPNLNGNCDDANGTVLTE